MDNRKICFITAVNDEVAYRECLFYIETLNIPDDYSVERIGIRNSTSITNAYNEACKRTNAKYKIYIHQDVFIINKNFIFDILAIFKEDLIAMIGVCGAKDIPINGVWWDSNRRVGKVYESSSGNMKLLGFEEVCNKYEVVQAIDGLIMITQHDIKWRDDLFDGWHFYDVSQSFEFMRKGYNVVVPEQSKPWGIHECGIANISNGFNEYRKKFIIEYLNE